MIEFKNIQNKKEFLGQFFTPNGLALDLLSKIEIKTDIVLEPSFGQGVFIDSLVDCGYKGIIKGIELDEELYGGYKPIKEVTLYNKNFYDYYLDFETEGLTFIGNPPFRTPAYSLKTHGSYLKSLSKSYNVIGIREEVIFFIMKTCDLIISNNIENGYIHYIVPETIIKNQTKYYKTFVEFLKNYFIISVTNIDDKLFDGVYQKLIFLSLELKKKLSDRQTCILIDKKEQKLETYLNGTSEKVIVFQEIFNKTYLGSVPCESIFVSVNKEPLESFIQRITKLFFTNIDSKETLLKLLSYKGDRYLKVLRGDNKKVIDNKLEIIMSYIEEIKNSGLNLSIFKDKSNYHTIKHRHNDNYYFRHTVLKRFKFVYELNPNPCKSFYFTGNPSYSSTDYFGFCDYDITRNSSPGACRTIPIDGIEGNLNDEFKKYWDVATNKLPYKYIFDYIIYISKTQWYRDIKKVKRRMYFSLPYKFDKRFLKKYLTK